MKLNGDYVIREIAGETLVVPVGRKALDLNAMITLDPVGTLIWKVLEAGTDEASLLEQILDGFEVDRETALTDLRAFLDQLEAAGMLER